MKVDKSGDLFTELVSEGVFPEDWKTCDDELERACSFADQFREWMDKRKCENNREGWLQVAAVAAYCQLWMDKCNHPDWVNMVRDFLVDFTKKSEEARSN